VVAGEQSPRKDRSGQRKRGTGLTLFVQEKKKGEGNQVNRRDTLIPGRKFRGRDRPQKRRNL